MSKPRVIIVDVRNGPVKEDGSNIDRPPEGQAAGLITIQDADVVVEIHADTMFVRRGVDKGFVTFITTKSVLQMNAEKAAAELDDRVGSKPNDDLQKGDHPVDVKMDRVWNKDAPGYIESGEPVEGGLKGF